MAWIEVTPCVWGVVGHSVSPGEHLPDRCQLHPQGIQHTTCWRWYCTQVTNADTDPEAAEEPRPPGERQGENLRRRREKGDRDRNMLGCLYFDICPFLFLSVQRCLWLRVFIISLSQCLRLTLSVSSPSSDETFPSCCEVLTLGR